MCVACGHHQPYLQLPLFALTGASGTGKSTIARHLVGALDAQVVVLEQDVLWSAGLRDPAGDYRLFRNTWLHMVAMIAQSGRPVVLCGTVVPVQLEHLPDRPLIGDIHYLALTCETGLLEKRLRSRPAWRGWDDPARISDTLEFNSWLSDNAAAFDPPMTVLDTTTSPLADLVDHVAAWIRQRL